MDSKIQMRKKDTIVVGKGPGCKSCGRWSQMVKHGQTFKPKPGKGYYEFWYVCRNKNCAVSFIQAPESFRHEDQEKQDWVNRMIDHEVSAGRYERNSGQDQEIDIITTQFSAPKQPAVFSSPPK